MCHYTPTNDNFFITLESASYDNGLAITFITTEGYYTITAYYFVYSHRVIGASVPAGKSFSCNQVDGFFNTENNIVISLTIFDLQFEVFDHSVATPISFSETWPCEGAMSMGVLVGLIVVMLLVAIEIYGIVWISGIGQNDRMGAQNLPGLAT